MIISSFFVIAETPPPTGLTYWNLSSLDDLWDGFNLVDSGTTSNNTFPTFNISGDSSPNSSYFNSGNDHLTNPTFLDTNIPGNFTISLWVNHATTFNSGNSDSEYIFEKENIDAEDRIACFFNQATGQITCFTEANDGGTVLISSIATSWTGGTWYHLVYNAWGVNGSHLYIDGILNDNDSSVTSKMADGTHTDFIIGNHADLTDAFDCIGCSIDDIKTFNKTLNITEVQNLHNYGNIIIPSPPIMANFSITAINNWSSNALSNFSAVVNVSGGIHALLPDIGGITPNRAIIDKFAILEHLTSKGQENFTLPLNCLNQSIINITKVSALPVDLWFCDNTLLGNVSDFVFTTNTSIRFSGNYTLYNDSGTGTISINLSNTSLYTISTLKTFYFPETVTNYNISSNLISSLKQSFISFACFEKVSNNSLTCLNSTIHPNATTYNFTVGVSGYFDVTQEETISILQNETLNFTGFYSTNLSINTTFITGLGTNICTYNVTNPTYPSYSESVSTTTNPNTSVGVINGSFSVLADCNGYAYQTINVTIINVTQTITFSLFTTNSANLTFYDSDTGNLMSGINVTVNFIGATSQTNITNTGFLYVDLLNPSEYTILSTSPNYRSTNYIFTLDDRENINIDIYMELSNASELVLITVIDKFGKDPIQNAEVTIQKYRNNTWVTDQIVNTDFQGLSEAHFILSTQNELAFYNFLVEFEGVLYFGVVNSNTNKKSIYAEDVTNGINIAIDTTPSNTVPVYQTSYDIINSIRYVNTSNTTGNFIFFYDDTNNIPLSAWLNVTEGGVLNCSTSTTSESASMSCAVNVPLGDVELLTGTGYLRIGEEWIPMASLTVWVGVDETVTFDWVSTGLGYIMSFFVVLIAFLLFAKIPSMSILSGTIAFGLLVLFRVLFQGMDIGIMVVFIFGAYLLSRIPSKSGVNA